MKLSYPAECQNFVEKVIRIREKYRNLKPTYKGNVRACVWYEVFDGRKKHVKGYQRFNQEFWTLLNNGIRVVNLVPEKFLENLPKIKLHPKLFEKDDWRNSYHDSFGRSWETFFQRLLCELIVELLECMEEKWFDGFQPLTKNDYDAMYPHLAKKIKPQ